MKLIVGLGNPGKEYEHTRHNAGWMVLDRVRDRIDSVVLVEKIILLKPQTFMNRSGEEVAEAVRFYKLDPSDVLVIHDDMDFPTGSFVFAKNGGAAGHHGVMSVIEALATESFSRLRIGIGRPTLPIPSDAYVLQKFSSDEIALVDNVVAQASNGVIYWVTEGIDKTMNTWNVVGRGGNSLE